MQDQHESLDALIERMQKELDGKLECGSQAKEELDELARKIREARKQELSRDERAALANESIRVLGVVIGVLPEVLELVQTLGG